MPYWAHSFPSECGISYSHIGSTGKPLFLGLKEYSNSVFEDLLKKNLNWPNGITKTDIGYTKMKVEFCNIQLTACAKELQGTAAHGVIDKSNQLTYLRISIK